MQSVKKALNAALAVCFIATVWGMVKLVLALSSSEPTGWICALIAASAILAFLVSFVLKPLKFKTRATPTGVSYPTRTHKADVLILVSVDEIRRAATHTDPLKRDWSFEWQNLIETAVGPYSTSDVSQMAPEQLQDYTVIVLTKSASVALDDTLHERLKAFMQEGGVLICEGPSSLLESTLPHDLCGQGVGPLSLDFIAPEFVPDELIREGISRRPFHTTLHKARTHSASISQYGQRGVKVLAASSGRPCIIHFPRQKGHLIAFLFELSTAMVVLKQGVYPRGFAARAASLLRRGWGWPKPAHFIPQLSDFAGDDPIPPLQELLADAVFRFAASLRPFPLVSRLPAGKRAFVVLTHDEDYAPGELAGVIEEAASCGAPSTAFLLPDSTRLRAIRKAVESGNVEAAFHWNRFRLHFDRRGIHSNPFVCPKSALDALEAAFPDRPIVSSRIHWLAWDPHPGITFQTLLNAGISVDSSQGPVSSGKGYIFATGYGYRPLSPEGAPIDLLEVPYEVEDGLGGANIDFVSALIEASIDGWHSGIVVLLHPWHCRKKARLRPMFEAILRTSQREEVWATTLRELHAFRATRSKCAISSVLTQNLLDIRVEVERDDMALLLPPRWGGLTIQGVKLDGALTDAAMLPGGVAIIPVPCGSHALVAEYGGGP